MHKRAVFPLTLAFLLLPLLTAAQSLTPASPEQVGMSAQRLAKITTVFKKEIDEGRIPGAVIAVARKGKLVYYESFGFGDKAGNVPMSKDSIFRIYSMTKPLVSVAAMLLVEDGSIQLTDPVAKFLPAFAKTQVSLANKNEIGNVVYDTVPAARPMTVHDLLRHTAGLAYGEITTNPGVKEAYAKAALYKAGVMEYEARDMTPAEQVERLAAIPLIHQPGTIWEYSMASDVLGRVVEAVSGKRLSEFLQERLFAPLQMRDTAFYVAPDKSARLAQPLATDPATGKPNRLIDVSQPPQNDSGGAGGVSTAIDYLRFAEMMLEGGALDGTRILSRTTVNLMASDHLGTRIATAATPGELVLGTPGYTFGLGFMVRQGAGVAGVPGSAGEFMWAGYAGTFFWIDPQEKLVAVLMTQAPGPSRPYYRRELKQLVYQAITD
jgi:CubicO group peptidase (beta-lactamase class C family)